MDEEKQNLTDLAVAILDDLEEGALPADASAQCFCVPKVAAGLRLDQALAQLMPTYSRSRLQQWIRADRVWLDGAPATQKVRVWGNEQLVVLPQPAAAELAFEPEPMALSIYFEDEHVLVLDKPAGLVVHPAAGNWSGTLLNGLLAHAPALAHIPRAGVVHRLDKQTSGLMMVAKTLLAQVDLVRQLQARTVKREYWAVVQAQITQAGTVNAPIGRHPVDRLRMAVFPEGALHAKPAVTHYRPLAPLNGATLIECRLESGRTHQIRVHMQSIGAPLYGDPVYGGRRCAQFNRQALHAHRLGMRHPAAQTWMQWEAPIPPDFQGLIARLT